MGSVVPDGTQRACGERERDRQSGAPGGGAAGAARAWTGRSVLPSCVRWSMCLKMAAETKWYWLKRGRALLVIGCEPSADSLAVSSTAMSA